MDGMTQELKTIYTLTSREVISMHNDRDKTQPLYVCMPIM